MKQFALTLALLASAAFAQTNTTSPSAPQSAPVAGSAQSAARDPQTVVGRVGNQNVTLADFERDFRIAVAGVVNAQGMPLTDEVMTEFAGAREAFLKDYLREQAILQLARQSVKSDAAALEAQVAQARAGFKTTEEFEQALRQTGFATAEDLRANLERQLLIRSYLGELQKGFTFGDAMVSGYYNLHRSEFARDAQACVKHILVPTQAAADAVVKGLAAGQDFAAIARAQSQDPGSASQGGDLGCIAPGDTVAAFDKASFGGPLNQPQVVQSEYGWHVLIVTRRSESGVPPLAEVTPLIRERLAREAAQKYLDTRLARIQTESFPDRVKVVTPGQ